MCRLRVLLVRRAAAARLQVRGGRKRDGGGGGGDATLLARRSDAGPSGSRRVRLRKRTSVLIKVICVKFHRCMAQRDLEVGKGLLALFLLPRIDGRHRACRLPRTEPPGHARRGAAARCACSSDEERVLNRSEGDFCCGNLNGQHYRTKLGPQLVRAAFSWTEGERVGASPSWQLGGARPATYRCTIAHT